jgi:hypothetical protein
VTEQESATPPHGDQLAQAPSEPRVPTPQPVAASDGAAGGIGSGGERLTRQEAFNLVGRAVAALTSGERAVPASAVREKAFELLGRDSESLSERMFVRILKDAHDGDVVDLRRRGDDFEVAVAAQAAPVAEQLNRAAAATAPAARAAAPSTTARGMGPRGAGLRGRGAAARTNEPLPDLLLLGVVDEPAPTTTITASLEATPASAAETPPQVAIVEDEAPKRGRGRKKPAAKKAAAKTPRAAAAPAAAPAPVAPVAVEPAAAPKAAKNRRGRGKKKATAAVEG